ncbi:MAG TPA: DUF4332 domain-containing protein [Chloroflexia bacterium]|nr:DUF4332 domain-containing protein [Chloroflexia bacterium]
MQAASDLLVQLKRLGIEDGDQLLKAGSTNLDRHGLAEALGVDVGQVIQLVNRADLLRVHGLDDAGIAVLARAGVRSLPALARCDPDSLCVRLSKLNGASAGVTPDPQCVALWVAEASRLPRMVWE